MVSQLYILMWFGKVASDVVVGENTNI
jgi:hypothetical protein